VKGDPVSERERFEDKTERAEAGKAETGRAEAGRVDDKHDVEAHKLDKVEKHEEPDVEGHKLEKHDL
jgi:hypothetical protein